MKSIGTIFSFTFMQHVKGKGYRNATILVTVLCFLLPALIMPAIEYFGKEEHYESKITKVYVIDEEQDLADYSFLNSADAEQFQNVTYEMADSVDTAAAQAASDGYAVILAVEKQGDSYQLSVLLPEDTELTQKDADAYAEYIERYFRYVLIQKSKLAYTQIAELTMPIEIAVRDTEIQEGETDEYAAAREIFSMILPYLNIMILYFMILAYGQGTANSAIMEKTSKLMDLFLVSVKPGAMLLGKVFATAASGILQLFCWLAGLAGGFAAGAQLVKAINPQSDMAILQLFDAFGSISGMFTPSGVILALLMLAAGLLLYCSLAAIGGAIAEKPEDLSSTNILFVLILIISFFATMYSGGTNADVSWDAVTWQVWMPFTAILVAPTKILLGGMSTPQAIGSLGIVLLTVVLVTLLAGKLYKMMSLYKGNLPGPAKLMEMLKDDK
ncbi:hypothetical protein BRYFOR_08271 [Marvinbryantia formatexigens DSM 14469]|uniref:ABC-2 type transporter transmembrane domain-containing protein n=1 Tax=Marvinbryantia formatexigens DSM 14469 TaxID=478749 RepID=C6LI00_9FIRM|nr:ABC transporter permease [Marvinbryantia formatexigens]EET59655.1 hypothetical protein BRYFOR_08271 [Marvinbryantia formatexigens DSM 14469]UWO26682.1 ABC transporter permease [Marvinbryantia formatexigens DSM 14469]SDG44417.1 ABC-type Na+ efflux pump, permease component [Marvinbryantia formatexigens]